MTFSLLANSSREVDENQEMELTIRSLSILIGPSGSSRLSNLMKKDSSASEPKIVAMMEYSESSSSEVNSPVSSGEVQIVEGDEIAEKFNDIQLEDLTIYLDDILDESTDTWKIGLELSEVLTIVGDNSEEFNENNNPVLNPANIDRGANHLAEGQTMESLIAREKVRLSPDEWKVIREAVENDTPIPSSSGKDSS
jgi:hypothetical protein